MGSGSRTKQYERRFFQGEQKHEEKEETFNIIKTLGAYEVREANGGYELLKNGEVVGTFCEAKVEEKRIIFKLSHGMNLEVSEKGVREILSPEKAELCGLIASDGCVCKYQSKKGKSTGYEVSLTTVDPELAEVFDKLAREVYSIAPHHYIRHHKTKEGEKPHLKVALLRRNIAMDLWLLGIKGPEPYEFHPPTRYLDEEGKRAYLRGFFSGDGNVSVGKKGHCIRIYSKCKEGLSELRKLFIDLGFHPSKIHTRDRGIIPEKFSGSEYYFTTPEEDHLKFIKEIGSEKEEHKSRLQLIRMIDEEKERREGKK
ncbi:MAG: LAGLIDADG family homing endonuclease [Thermoproteota archaeon]